MVAVCMLTSVSGGDYCMIWVLRIRNVCCQIVLMLNSSLTVVCLADWLTGYCSLEFIHVQIL